MPLWHHKGGHKALWPVLVIKVAVLCPSVGLRKMLTSRKTQQPRIGRAALICQISTRRNSLCDISEDQSGRLDKLDFPLLSVFNWKLKPKKKQKWSGDTFLWGVSSMSCVSKHSGLWRDLFAPPETIRWSISKRGTPHIHCIEINFCGNCWGTILNISVGAG